MTTTTEKVWTTQDGREIPISQMEDSHLLATLKMIKNKSEDSAYCQGVADSIKELLEACQQEIKEPCEFFRGEYAVDLSDPCIQDTIHILEQRLVYLSESNPNPAGIHWLYPDLYQEAIRRGLR